MYFQLNTSVLQDSDIYLVDTVITFSVILYGGAGYVVTWDPSITWENDTPPALGDIDIITFISHDSGSVWYGVHSMTYSYN